MSNTVSPVVVESRHASREGALLAPAGGGLGAGGLSTRRGVPVSWLVAGALALGGASAAAYFAGRSAERAAEPAAMEAAAMSPSAADGKGLSPKAALAKSTPTAPAAAEAPAPVISCANCGVVESVTAVERKGEGSGVGAVAGTVVGGALGNQVGKGNGRTAMTVLGAIGGAVAGHEVEKRARSVTVYRVKVRTDGGELRTVEHASAPAVGQRVKVEGQKLQMLAS
jgi:outer membrane lipoprotein SlyB